MCVLGFWFLVLVIWMLVFFIVIWSVFYEVNVGNYGERVVFRLCENLIGL